MLSDAAKDLAANNSQNEIEVLDIAEIVAAQLDTD